MKTINVVAAVIIRTSPQGNRQVFATQHSYGDWKGWWEFPGGKIEEWESPEAALEREIREELATQIKYDYPAFHLSMQCFACDVLSGKLELLEHENAIWLTAENLHSVNWLPADELILDKIGKLLNNA